MTLKDSQQNAREEWIKRLKKFAESWTRDGEILTVPRKFFEEEMIAFTDTLISKAYKAGEEAAEEKIGKHLDLYYGINDATFIREQVKKALNPSDV